MNEIGLQQDHINIYCDNQNAIMLPKHPAHHERTKHIDVMLFFIRDIISRDFLLAMV